MESFAELERELDDEELEEAERAYRAACAATTWTGEELKNRAKGEYFADEFADAVERLARETPACELEPPPSLAYVFGKFFPGVLLPDGDCPEELLPLREKLEKLERLAEGGATEGEREAARLAAGRVRERIKLGVSAT